MGAGAARALALAVLAAALALAVPAAQGRAPVGGVLEPGVSLGQVEIGMSKTEVKSLWGNWFGRCRDCARETWYFNYRRFEPQGTGVTFVDGRVVQVFTVWQPEGWQTTTGLTLGAAESEVPDAYPDARVTDCGDYSAYVLEGDPKTAFYIDDGELWGFGITRSPDSPCP